MNMSDINRNAYILKQQTTEMLWSSKHQKVVMMHIYLWCTFNIIIAMSMDLKTKLNHVNETISPHFNINIYNDCQK